MDSAPHSWITPTTCFSIACVAFSFVAASTVWRQQQSVPVNKHKKIQIRHVSSPIRPQPRRRVAVDSLYAESGDALYDKIASTVNANQSKFPKDLLLDLISKCAQLSQAVRSLPIAREMRVTISALLGELSYLTTILCRLQQQLASQPDKLENEKVQSACFDTTTGSLKATLATLEADVSLPHLDVQSVDESIRQLRDQRPSLDLLLESLSSNALPPTPPCEVFNAETLHAACGSSQALLAPNIFQASTGLTPASDSRSWLEPPPEYSPPANGTSGVFPGKADAKVSIPEPPEPQSEEQAEEYDTDALYNAVTQDDLGLVNDLLALGANPGEVIGELHRTPLHQAAHLNHVACLSSLLRSGAAMSTEDRKGDTPLHLAAWAGHVEALQILIAHGADVDWLSGRDGYSPLWCAISAYHIDAARILLKHGARVSLRSASGGGLTPLHQAAVTGQSAMCELLLERGAQVDLLDEDKNTSLHYAAASGSAASVQILLRAGAQVDAEQVQGLTPLHWAAHKGHTDVLSLLLSYGAPVDSRAEENATPLHLAANRGHVPAVRALLGKGANRKVKANWDGGEGTPAQMARAKGHVRVLKALQSS